MAYSNQTTNYGLPLPLGTDKSNFMDTNTAFQAVDTALKGAVDGVAALSGTTGGISEALTGLTNRVDGIDTDITQLKNADGTIVGNFGTVETGQVSAHEYATGDMFVWLNVVRKATVAIHVGDQFVNGTNCMIVSLDEIIGNLAVLDQSGGSIVSALNKNKWIKVGEVIADGVKTRGTLLNELVDPTYINTDYELKFFEYPINGGRNDYNNCRYVSGSMHLVHSFMDSLGYYVDSIYINSTSSASTRDIIPKSGGAWPTENNTTNVVTSGVRFALYAMKL